MINSKFLRNDRGFTLIEVLVSLTILGIVLTSTMSFFSQSYTYTKMNEDKTIGINFARNVLYYIEQLNYEDVNNYILTNGTGDNKLTSIDCSSSVIENSETCYGIFDTSINNEKFDVTVEVQLHNSLEKYLIPVKVEVKWGKDLSTIVEGVIKK